MGTTDPKHSHGGLTAAFAQQPFANIQGCNKGKCIMHALGHPRYYPKWDRGVRRYRVIPNLLKAETAYEGW